MPVCPWCDTPQRVDRDGIFRFHGLLGLVCDGVGEVAPEYADIYDRKSQEREMERAARPVDHKDLLAHKRVKRDECGRRLL